MQLTNIFHLKKLALALTATLAATLPSTARDFTYTYEGQTITYTVTNEDAKTCMTAAGTADAAAHDITGDLILPGNPMDGDTEFKLVQIGDYSFYNNSNLTSLEIPATVSAIMAYAFNDCTGMKAVKVLGSGIKFDSAFDNCTGLEKVEFTSIKNACSMTYVLTTSNPLYYAKHLFIDGEEVFDIVIPNTITKIPASTFVNCAYLKSVDIPNTVTSIGKEAFYGCKTIQSIVIPDKITKIEYGTFYACTGLKEVTLPPALTQIDGNGFISCVSLTKISFPETLTSIGSLAFFGDQSLKEVVLPPSVNSITSTAFNSCSGLVKTACPSSIATNPFPKGTNITYPADDAKIVDGNIYSTDETTLYYVPLATTEFEIPESVTTIGEYAFASCALNEITIPSNVKTIKNTAFDSCNSLKKSNFESIEQLCSIRFTSGYANPISHSYNLYINGEEITDLVIPNTVTSIGFASFYSCYGLKSVTIPASVTTIGKSSFRYCRNLKTVVIPPTATTIGETAFADCSGLVKSAYPEDSQTNPFSNGTTTYGAVITYPRDAQFVDNVIYSVDGSQLYFVPIDVTEFEMPEDVQTVGENAFAACTKVGTLKVTPIVPTATDASFDPTMFDHTLLQVPDTKESDYRAADGWKRFKQIETYHIPVPAIAVEPTELELTEGESEKVEASLTDLPEDTEITWTSSDEEVATVSADGTITAVAPGTATIAATAADLSATVEVTVTRQLHPAIAIDAEDLEMTVGDSKQLSITRTDLSDDEVVTWLSSDPDVASVDDEGLLTAIEAGTATITAYCGTAEASIKVTVKSKGGTTLITNVKAVAPDEDLYDLRGIKVSTPTRSQIYIRRKK